MSLLDTHNTEERFEDGIGAWIGSISHGFGEEFSTQIRFVGIYESLPKLTDDMVGSVVLLQCEPYLESYIAVRNSYGRLSWSRLNYTTEV